jgi:hypothetical protein
MPKLIAFLFMSVIPLLPQLITSIVSKAAVALGFGTATFFGLNLLFEQVLTKIGASASGLPKEVLMMIGLVGVDDAINIFCSAGVALFTLKGMNAMGKVRTAVWRKPGDKSPIEWGA